MRTRIASSWGELDTKINNRGANRVLDSVNSIPFINKAGLMQAHLKVVFSHLKEGGNLTEVKIHPASICVKDMR